MKCHLFKLLCLRKLQLKYVTAENDLSLTGLHSWAQLTDFSGKEHTSTHSWDDRGRSLS